MNVFMRELKANRKSLIFWCIGVVFMVSGGMSKYGGLSGTGQSMSEMIEKMPRSLQAIWGTGSLDLSTASGYYGLLFLYLVLMATIHAIMLGANIISKEERDKSSEFLMVKPISRTNIITAKLVAAFVNVVVFNIITMVSSIMMVNYFGEDGSVTSDIVLLMVGMFLLQLLFLGVGTGIAALSKRPKSAVSLGSGVLLATFLLSIMVSLNEKIDGLKYFTPFKYFEAKNILIDGKLDPVYVILSVGIMAVMLFITYIFYQKKDLNA